MKEVINKIEIESVNEIKKEEEKMNIIEKAQMEYRKIHAEHIGDGRFVYIVESNLNTMYELSEFEHCSHDGFDIYVSEGEYPGCAGEILVYNKKPWLENGYGFKFEPGEKTPREVVNFLHRRMYALR